MKIYFSGSIRGGRDDADLYQDIISYLKNYGEILTEHIGDSNLSSNGESQINNKKIHDRDLELLSECDVVVAEITNPSLGVGYEIAKAIECRKLVYCFYRIIDNKKISAMILGSDKVECFQYDNLSQLKKILESLLSVTKWNNIIILSYVNYNYV